MPTVIWDGFEWDSEKSKLNVENHGIGFDEALDMYDLPVLEYEIIWKNYETRNLAVGEIEGKCYCMVYGVRHEKRRIISVRRARDYEEEAYQNWKEHYE